MKRPRRPPGGGSAGPERRLVVSRAGGPLAPRAATGGCHARTQEPTRSSATRGDEDAAWRRQGPLECRWTFPTRDTSALASLSYGQAHAAGVSYRSSVGGERGPARGMGRQRRREGDEGAAEDERRAEVEHAEGPGQIGERGEGHEP